MSNDQKSTATASSGGGLTQVEAKQLLEKCGYNELPEKHVNAFLKLLTYFNGPIPWMIEAAALSSKANP